MSIEITTTAELTHGLQIAALRLKPYAIVMLADGGCVLTKQGRIVGVLLVGAAAQAKLLDLLADPTHRAMRIIFQDAIDVGDSAELPIDAVLLRALIARDEGAPRSAQTLRSTV